MEWRQSSFSLFFAARSVSTALTSTAPAGAAAPGAGVLDRAAEPDPEPVPGVEAGELPGEDCALACPPKIADMMFPKIPMTESCNERSDSGQLTREPKVRLGRDYRLWLIQPTAAHAATAPFRNRTRCISLGTR